MRIIRALGGWISVRLGMDQLLGVLRHPVPPETASGKKGWMYVFGTATLLAFLLQVVTGIALATKYVPTPAHAYESLRFITDEVWLGNFLRGLHYFGASAMVALVVVHMARVFLTGSYKYPRELNWLTGVALFLLTIAMAFTGQLLRWDANGVWGVVVAAHYAARVPLIGGGLKEFILAGDTVGGATLSRFYAFHVILMPLLIFGIMGLHLYLALHHGVSEPPEPGRPVERKTYRRWYASLLERSDRTYFPDVTWREGVAGVVVLAAIFTLALTVGARGPAEPADPTAIPTEPKPDWFLLWYYGLIAIKPPRVETFMMVYLPILVILVLLFLPLVFSTGERSPRRRPWAVPLVVVVLAALGVLTELGSRAPWVMDFETRPLSAEELGTTDPVVLRGAELFHERGCQYCHAVDGRGGQYGPPLAGVMRRLPPEVVTARIVQGFGDMPAYRRMLRSEELTAILTFLHALEAQ